MSEQKVVRGILLEDETVALYDFEAVANVPKVIKEIPVAKVGQYLVVEEVDSDGKITKVKAVTGSSSATESLDAINLYVCSDGEYTAGGIPTIELPDESTYYWVPQDNKGTRYASWVYAAGVWKFVEDLIVTFEETEGVKVPEKTAMATTLYGFYPYGKYHLSLYGDKATRDAALASGDHNTESMMPWANIESAFASGVVRLDIKSGNESYDDSVLLGKGTLLAYYPYKNFNDMRLCLTLHSQTHHYMDTIYPAVYED